MVSAVGLKILYGPFLLVFGGFEHISLIIIVGTWFFQYLAYVCHSDRQFKIEIIWTTRFKSF